MLLLILLLAALPLAAQNCPSFAFVGPANVNLSGHRYGGGIVRQPDGSFTYQRYSLTPTTTNQTQTPQFQTNFYNCIGLPARPTPVRPPGYQFGADQLGVQSRPAVFSDLAGNGTTTGIGIYPFSLSQTQLTVVKGTTTFAPAANFVYNIAADPAGLLVGDFNGDGKRDIAALSMRSAQATGAVQIYLGVGDGTLSSSPLLTSTGKSPSSATAFDFNGDGKLDLAVANAGGSSLMLLFGNGDGTFQTPITLAGGSAFPAAVAAADINKDGRVDLIIGHNSGVEVRLGNGNGTFQAPSNVFTGGNISNVAVGDFNKDGNPDIAASSRNSAALNVLLGNGAGAFPSFSSSLTKYNVADLILVDFDWDGNLDILLGEGHPDVLVAEGYDNNLFVLFGRGDGTFHGLSAYAVPNGATGMVLADVNGDGRADILTSGSASANGNAGILLNAGGGLFTKGTSATILGQFGPTFLSGIDAADVNGDGKIDLLAVDSNRVYTALGNGNATFQAATSFISGNDLRSVIARDWNGDGKLDLAYVSYRTKELFTALGNNNGTYSNPAAITVGENPVQVVSADLNQDNKLDLVVVNQGNLFSIDGSVQVLLGAGNGTFQPPSTMAAGLYPSKVTVADATGDGKLDLIVSTQGANFAFQVIIFPGRGDGTFQPPTVLTVDYGPDLVGVADFNGDGKIDLLVPHCCGDTALGVLLGNGNGSFQGESYVAAGRGQQFLLVRDFNNDGKPDAAFISGFDTSYVATLVNVSNPTPVISVLTNPAGLSIQVDGVSATAPQTYSWTAGTPHTIATTSPQNGAPGTRHVFANWSDGGAISHSVSPQGSTTYTAAFTTQYQLTLAASPSTGGVVTAQPSGDSFYTSGTRVTIAATANPGCSFLGFGGSLIAQSSPQTVTMTSAKSVTALFSCTGVAPPPQTGWRFVSMAPCRVMETRPEYNFEGRSGAFGPPFLTAGSTRTLAMNSSTVCQIPLAARAYVLNVTLIPRGAADFVTVYPAGDARPDVWTVRSPDGQIVANSAIVKAGINNGISIYTSNDADFLIDIAGYFTDNAALSNLVYYPVTPCRVIETRSLYRSPAGPFGPPSMGAQETRSFRFPSSPDCAVPDGAAAYSISLTVVPPQPLPYLTTWPTGVTQPNVSSINSFVGRTLANNIIVPASPDGSINVFAFANTDFLMDITGVFAPDNGTGLYYFPVTQCRTMDTRGNGFSGFFGGPIMESETSRTLPIPSSTSCIGIPSAARAYALSATAIPNGSPMPFLTLWGSGAARPNASMLNAFEGQTVTGSAIIPAGGNGSIDVFAYRRTHVVVDVSGYFARTQ
ncbi:MAG: VCBS repeat-containing protein [Acidobacteria bacterium]|nr:VCBS repeat-containing protein [Acidobacteriota bacterium]